MSQHPRIEEVSDSDPDDAGNLSDPSEPDIDDFLESDIIRTRASAQARNQPASSSSASQQSRQAAQQQSQQQQQEFMPPLPQPPGFPSMPTTTDSTAYKSYLCIYPIYFDSKRSRAEGRRVSASLAVPNPLASEIVHACSNLRVSTVLEPGKLHPKDWSNPGRVKVDLASNKTIKNKHHLFVLVAEHLRRHPVTQDSNALRVMVRGVPPPPVKPGEPWPKPAIPRGWKMNELLPHYSPAMTGGGVSENFLKDMMSQMGGPGGPPGAGGAGAGGMPDMASLLQSMGGGGAGGGGGMPDMASLLQSMGGGFGGGGFPGFGGGGGGSGSGSSTPSAGGKKKGKK